MFEQWVSMESFFYQAMTIEIAVAIIFGILILATVFNLKNKSVKRIFITSALIVFSMISLIVWGLNKHSDLIDITRYENAAVRQYKVVPFNKFHYSNTETSIYRVGYMVDSFINIGLYEPHAIEQEIEYHGSNDNFIYFQIGNTRVYANKRYGEFSEEVSTSKRIGTQYSLIESEFSEIGFYETSSKFFEKYLIPNALADLKVTDDFADAAVYQHTEDVIASWVVQ